jgi:hypothetical protein
VVGYGDRRRKILRDRIDDDRRKQKPMIKKAHYRPVLKVSGCPCHYIGTLNRENLSFLRWLNDDENKFCCTYVAGLEYIS